MIDAVILIPSMIASLDSRSQSSVESLLRDSILLATVFALHSIDISLPRGLFVAAGCFVMCSEIINDLTYRFLPPSKKLKTTWLNLQGRQIKKDLIRYIELRNDCTDCYEAPDSNNNLLRNNNMVFKGVETHAETIATDKNNKPRRF